MIDNIKIESKLNYSLPYTLTIFTACDKEYFEKHAFHFCASFNENMPGCHIHIHIYNLDENIKLKIKNFKKLFSSTKITISSEYEDYFFKNLSEVEKTSYFANIRFLRLYNILTRIKKDILFLDIDSLIVNNLFELINKNSDISIYQRYERIDINQKVLAGTIYIKYSRNSLIFLENVIRNLLKDNLYLKWYADQRSLYKALLETKSLTIENLDIEYIDFHFNKNSFIWTGKGKRKFENKTYTEYKDLLKEIYAQNRSEVTILLPRIDLGFKINTIKSINSIKERIKDPLRQNWWSFAFLLRHKLRKEGFKVKLIVKPFWHLQELYIKKLTSKIIFIPHMSKKQFTKINKQYFFYMQEFYPWLFGIDEEGWGPTSSKVDSKEWKTVKTNEKLLNSYYNLITKNISKYKQPSNNYTNLKKNSYIFFPLQIPHDLSIKYGFHTEQIKLIKELCFWAEKNKKLIVFKYHPFFTQELLATYIPEEFKQFTFVKFIKNFNIHSLIENSKCIYCINSGVGFESLFHHKKVVNFGKSLYSSVTINGNMSNLDETYNNMLNTDINKYIINIKKFLTWILNDYCSDISRKTINITQITKKLKND